MELFDYHHRLRKIKHGTFSPEFSRFHQTTLNAALSNLSGWCLNPSQTRHIWKFQNISDQQVLLVVVENNKDQISNQFSCIPTFVAKISTFIAGETVKDIM